MPSHCAVQRTAALGPARCIRPRIKGKVAWVHPAVPAGRCVLHAPTCAPISGRGAAWQPRRRERRFESSAGPPARLNARAELRALVRRGGPPFQVPGCWAGRYSRCRPPVGRRVFRARARARGRCRGRCRRAHAVVEYRREHGLVPEHERALRRRPRAWYILALALSRAGRRHRLCVPRTVARSPLASLGP